MAKITYILSNLIVPFAENPREKLEYRDLVPSIRERGLDKPLLVRIHPTIKDHFEIAQGHRRFAALNAIEQTAVESFKAHFPKGIPCEVMSKDTTQQDFILAVADHGESRGLTTDYELYMLAKLLFKAGCTREGAILKMASVLNTAKPFKKPELTQKVNEYLRQMEDLTLPVRDRAKAEVEYEDLVTKARTGLMQRYQAIFQMPEIVEATYQFVCTGVKRPGFEQVTMPAKFTESHIKKLYAEKDGYLRDVKNGDADGHPLFNERWNEVLKETNGETPADNRKSRARKEMIEAAEGMQSTVAKTILNFCANEAGVGVEKVKALDEALQMLDWLINVEKDKYEELLASFRTWAIIRDEVTNGPETEETETK